MYIRDFTKCKYNNNSNIHSSIKRMKKEKRTVNLIIC